MKLTIAPEATEQLSKLLKEIQKKAKKQFTFLISNFIQPGLIVLPWVGWLVKVWWYI